MASIVDPDPDGKTDAPPPICGEYGGTVGVAPDTIELRCQRPSGHAERHYSSVSRWFGAWTSSDVSTSEENH